MDTYTKYYISYIHTAVCVGMTMHLGVTAPCLTDVPRLRLKQGETAPCLTDIPRLRLKQGETVPCLTCPTP